MNENIDFECVVLMATKDRWDFLTQRSLPSVCSQTQCPKLVVLVNDGKIFDKNEYSAIKEILRTIPIIVLPNIRKPGAAGSWNTGLKYLKDINFNGFVAILDDDDEWDKDHIELNMHFARETGAELVVSGLRRICSGQIKPRKLPINLKDLDFLRGNPGLQGSNTFVSLKAMNRVGNFTEGLPSLNDRDLAIRLLRSPIQVAYTNQWTATWHHDNKRKTLSSPRSKEKILGLQWFWNKYKKDMSEEVRAAYLDRAYRCFGVTHAEVEENWGVDGIGI